MSSIFELPDELLLAVAQELSVTNLLNLALTSRRLRAIAQEVLVSAPVVPRSSNIFESHIGDLLRTLLQRPDLAAFVKNISLSPSVRYIEVDFSVSIDANGRYIFVPQPIGLNIAMWEPRMAANILDLVPNVVDLEMTPRGSSHDSKWEDSWVPDTILQAIFQSRTNPDGNVDLSDTQSFSSLKSLLVQTRIFESEWPGLPKLERLHLVEWTQQLISDDVLAATSATKLTHLVLNFDRW
jgi:hypothetical protein